jgi:hypothetical protein
MGGRLTGNSFIAILLQSYLDESRQALIGFHREHRNSPSHFSLARAALLSLLIKDVRKTVGFSGWVAYVEHVHPLSHLDHRPIQRINCYLLSLVLEMRA